MLRGENNYLWPRDALKVVSKITPKQLSPFLKLRSLLEGIGKFLRNSVKEKLC